MWLLLAYIFLREGWVNLLPPAVWLNKLMLQEFMKLFQLIDYRTVSFLLLNLAPVSVIKLYQWCTPLHQRCTSLLTFFSIYCFSSGAYFSLNIASFLHVTRLVLLTDNLTSENTQRRPLKKFISRLMSVLVHFVLNLLACVLLFPWLKGLFVAQHSCKKLENQTKSPLPCTSSQEQSISQAVENQSFHPCWERLQRLEELVTDLVNKPKRIPPEKEDMLLESLSRIKSIEHDLQRTKKVSSFFSFVLYAACFFNFKNLGIISI